MNPCAHPSRFIVTLAACLIAVGLPAAEAIKNPIAVRETKVLYDGAKVNDLSNFYTWLEGHGYQDPNRVFTIVDRIDGAPAIRISGETWGGLVTREHYSRYKLVAEFRWGPVTWGKRKKMGRNSGVLLHCAGEDGNHKSTFESPWMSSIEYEILEGRTGIAVLVPGFRERGGTERILPRATMRALPGSFRWNPAGEPREIIAGHKRLQWPDEDAAWRDVLGFRGAKDIEKPAGEWNLAEALVDEGHLTFFINGVKVMELTDCSLTSGRLLFQSEDAEIYFRRIELQPLQP